MNKRPVFASGTDVSGLVTVKIEAGETAPLGSDLVEVNLCGEIVGVFLSGMGSKLKRQKQKDMSGRRSQMEKHQE